MARRDAPRAHEAPQTDPFEGMTAQELEIAREVWPTIPRRPLTSSEVEALSRMSRRALERLWQKTGRPIKIRLPTGGVRYAPSEVLRLLSGKLAREISDGAAGRARHG